MTCPSAGEITGAAEEAQRLGGELAGVGAEAAGQRRRAAQLKLLGLARREQQRRRLRAATLAALRGVLAEADAAAAAARHDAARHEAAVRAGVRRTLHAQVTQQMQSLCAIAAMCEPAATAGKVA